MSVIERGFAITLDGTVSLDRWSRVLSAWNKSLDLIADQVGDDHVLGMRLTGLTYGSAVTEIGAHFSDEVVADRFTDEHDKFSRALRDGNIVDFPQPLQRSGLSLLSAARRDEASEFVISSDTGDFVVALDRKLNVSEPVKTPASQDQVVAFGAVVGILQSLSSRGSLKAVVFDEMNDKAVRCFLSEDQHDVVGSLWDHLVEVIGTVSRDPQTGRPLSIRDVVSIGPVDRPDAEMVGETDWMKARGALRALYPDATSTELTRAARDE